MSFFVETDRAPYEDAPRYFPGRGEVLGATVFEAGGKGKGGRQQGSGDPDHYNPETGKWEYKRYSAKHRRTQRPRGRPLGSRKNPADYSQTPSAEKSRKQRERKRLGLPPLTRGRKLGWRKDPEEYSQTPDAKKSREKHERRRQGLPKLKRGRKPKKEQ